VNRFIVLWLLVITESGVGDPLDYVADLHAYWLEELVIERSFDLWVTPAVEPNYVVGEQDKSYFVTYPQPQVEPNCGCVMTRGCPLSPGTSSGRIYRKYLEGRRM